MFGEPALAASTHERSGRAQAFSELVATFGLLAVIRGCARRAPVATPFAVGAYITAAYWFTASTSFANPAVTLARAATNTFSGIRPADVPGFLVAQLVGAALATAPLPLARCRGRPVKTVVFACVQNAGRSQMAAAFFTQLANPQLARAVSAGTRPAARVHPEVVATMREVGIDLSGRRAGAAHAPSSRRTRRGSSRWAAATSARCCPASRRDDWPLADPAGPAAERVREIRDEIEERVWQLIAKEGWWKLRPAQGGDDEGGQP